MWDLIVSVPDHCLSFYFIFLRKRNSIIVFPVTKVTLDPVSVLRFLITFDLENLLKLHPIII